jgi:hypothetical protein
MDLADACALTHDRVVVVAAHALDQPWPVV